jgi:protein lin-28
MPTGKVAIFFVRKGFGFIQPDEGGDDIFVHHSAIQAEGFTTLADGEEVEYELETAENGKTRAVNVRGPGGAAVLGVPKGKGRRKGKRGVPKGKGKGKSKGKGGKKGPEVAVISAELARQLALEFGPENPTRCTTPAKLEGRHVDYFTRLETQEELVWDCEENNHLPLWRPHRERWGATKTLLADGRKVSVGGQYEDSYDPQFAIFNDVLVEHPGGRSELLTYPLEELPPTDYHAACEAGGWLYLIGNVGYAKYRKDKVQVLRLDTRSWRAERVSTRGLDLVWSKCTSARLEEGGDAIACDLEQPSSEEDEEEVHSARLILPSHEWA